MQNTQDNISTFDSSIEKLRKELHVTRIFSAVSSILMICILVGDFLVCSKVQSYVEEIWPLVEELSTVDYAVLNDTIAGLDTEQLTLALENLNAAAGILKELEESLEPITSLFKR